MALRIFLFSTLFTLGYSLGILTDLNLHGPSNLPVIGLSLNLTDPKDVVVPNGQSTTLKCEAVSTNGDIRFTWRHNGEEIRANDSRWMIKPDGSLYIPKVLTGQESSEVVGEYECMVKNNDGALLSDIARLKVASIESKFSTDPKNQNVPEGETLVLRCDIHSIPPVTIQWELNNATLPHNNRYVPLPYGALIIYDSRISDSGSYRCRATNNLIKTTRFSKAAVVSVTTSQRRTTAPSILPLDVSLNKTILVGESLTLYCAVIGWPKPTVLWVNDNDIVISNGTSLEIVDASKRDTGNYSCIAQNNFGHAKRQFRIDVMAKPRFTKIPISRFSPPSITVRLNCSAEGVPDPEIIWLKDGKPLNYTARIKKQTNCLLLSQPFPNDSGLYQCVAVNSMGRVWTAARISVHHRFQPTPPKNVQCRPYDATSICLNWTASSNVMAYSIYSTFKSDGIEQWGPGLVSNTTFSLIEGLNSNINYTFYIISFTNAASNSSEHVVCSPGFREKRKVETLLMEPDKVLVKWNEISSDRKCNGKRNAYKVQWREEGQKSPYAESTNEESIVIKRLMPKKYEIRITTINDPEPSWIGFIVPLFSNSSNKINVTELNQNESVPVSPNNLDGEAKSGTSVLLTWTNLDSAANFYTVCYFSVTDNKEDCDEKNQLTSYKTNLEIDGLQANTTYAFKVRAYNFNKVPGPYSQQIEIHTPEEVPSPVRDLNYKILNESTVCLHWQEPQRKNGKLKGYIISYAPDKNWPLENWFNISIPPHVPITMNCWISEQDLLGTSHGTVSLSLKNLSPETKYLVFVRAISQVGIGYATPLVTVSTKIIKSPQESSYKQKLGIILGTIVALVCILTCIVCLFVRRKCLKRRASARADLRASNNLYPAVAHYTSHADSVQVRLEDTCAQEIQHLVPDSLTTNIQPITSNFIDTKGGEEFPNGHLNGSAKPFMNGGFSKKPMHIRENPQYYEHQYNGIGNKKSFRFEEDSNSNVKPSKFYNLHRLFENSKKAGSSKYNQCSALENIDKNIQSSDDETPNEYDSLNVTRLTCLNDSFDLNVNNNKRVLSPMLSYNG